MGLHVVSANRLRDGVVVYLTADGGWSERIADARTADKDEAAALVSESERAAGGIVAPYAIDVEIGDGAPRPTRLRERIRAYGPPVHPQFGRAAASETKG